MRGDGAFTFYECALSEFPLRGVGTSPLVNFFCGGLVHHFERGELVFLLQSPNRVAHLLVRGIGTSGGLVLSVLRGGLVLSLSMRFWSVQFIVT